MKSSIELVAVKKRLNHHIKLVRRLENKRLRRDYPTWFLLLDFALIFIVLFNVGAHVLTNALVVKDNPGLELVEANPVTSQIQGYKTSSEANSKYFLLVAQLSITLLLAFGLLYYRFFMVTYYGLWGYTFLVGSVFFLNFFDFMNDLAYYIGLLL